MNNIDKYFENIDTNMYVNITCLNVKYFRHSLAFFRMYDRIDSFFVFLRHWLIVLWEHLLFEWVVFVTHSGAPHFHFPSQKINFPANAASAPIAWAIVKFGTVAGENIHFRT